MTFSMSLTTLAPAGAEDGVNNTEIGIVGGRGKIYLKRLAMCSISHNPRLIKLFLIGE